MTAAHHQLQRVLVRMLHDPEFAEAALDPARGVPEALGIPADLCASLRRHPRDAFRTDPQRPLRLLKALVEEYRVTTALLMLHTPSVRTLAAFFGSAEFHEDIQSRGFVAISFGQWLERCCADSADLVPALHTLAVERALVRARRRLSGTGRWRLVPGVGVALVPQGTLGLIQHIEQYLFDAELQAHAALARDVPRPAALPTLGSGQECWIAEAERGLSGVPLIHGAALDRVQRGCPLPADDEVLNELAAHGLVERGS